MGTWKASVEMITFVYIMFIIGIKCKIARYQTMWDIAVIWIMSFEILGIWKTGYAIYIITNFGEIYGKVDFCLFCELWVCWKLKVKNKACFIHDTYFNIFFWNCQYLLNSTFIFLFVTKHYYWYYFYMKGFEELMM